MYQNKQSAKPSTQNKTNLYHALNGYTDILSVLPEEKIRQSLPEMRVPHGVDFTREIGGTEYIVTSHLNKNSENDMFKIVSRLLECDILYSL